MRPADDATALQSACVAVPKALVNVPAKDLDELLCRPITSTGGIDRLLIAFVTDLCDHGPGFRPADGPRVGMALLDLVCALLLNSLETTSTAAHDNPRLSAFTRRIKAYIQQNLREPGLTPGAVATAHHISVSYLHRLFQRHGHTVTAWIRQQRLERARSDLADPALRDVPIQAIAEAWGFSHASDFSRAFRRAFGSSASTFRRQVHRQQASWNAGDDFPQRA
ncbi:helix-turn-helix transcriptional regulator [Nonomuraea antimicrobica]|uniref:helix-turn-helix transcriptional regulator n=1 Tax=Nonomuraea antimicrobica TaxID=561173 RepID=UPI0031EC1352